MASLPIQYEDAEQLQLELNEEIAYQFIIKKFEENFNLLNSRQASRLEIDADSFSPEELEKNRRDFKRQRLATLHQASVFCRETIKGVLERQNKIQDIKELEPPSIKMAEKCDTNGSIYSFEQGILKIIDPEFNLHYEEKFVPNEIGGRRCLYDDQGFTKYEGFYRNGKLHGPSSYYGTNRELLAKNWFIDGLQQGKTNQFFHSGALYGVKRFQDGLQHGAQERYFENGVLRSILPFKHGVLHGQVIINHDNGIPARTLSFIEGRRNGPEKFWDRNGRLMIEAEFKDDQPIGRSRVWYENGNLSQEILYGEDSEILSSQHWDFNGAIINESQTEKLDYFENIAKQTGVLADSLSSIIEHASAVAPLVSEAGQINKKSNIPEDLSQDFLELQQEMQKLHELHNSMLFESGLDAKNPEEAIWKTPSVQRELQHKLDSMTKEMHEGVAKLQASFIQTVEGLSKISKAKDEVPSSSPSPSEDPPKEKE